MHRRGASHARGRAHLAPHRGLDGPGRLRHVCVALEADDQVAGVQRVPETKIGKIDYRALEAEAASAAQAQAARS